MMKTQKQVAFDCGSDGKIVDLYAWIENETFLVTFHHCCNFATAAVKHLHLCAADVKGLLDAVSHVWEQPEEAK